MIWVQFAVVLGAILLGARLGGIAIGFAGGLGVLVLALLGVTPGDMPLDVISIIMSVIVAIAAMQVAGGMAYLVSIAERILRRNPQHLTFLAAVITLWSCRHAAGSGRRSHAGDRLTDAHRRCASQQWATHSRRVSGPLGQGFSGP